MLTFSLKYIEHTCAEVHPDRRYQEILCFEKIQLLDKYCIKEDDAGVCSVSVGWPGKAILKSSAALSACVALIRAQSISCWRHHVVITVAGVPFALHHLLLNGSHPERSPEQPSRKERFLANSASVISINIKLIKTSVINILAFVLVSLIYLNKLALTLPFAWEVLIKD